MANTRELAPIQNGVIYPLDNFQLRTGMGRHAMRAARRSGLKVIRLGSRVFVRGDDFNAFLETLSNDSQSTEAV